MRALPKTMTTRPHHAQDSSRDIRSFLEKIVVSAGIGRLSQLPNFEEKALPQLARDLGLIAAQKPRVARAKKSIAGFKIREGQIVGLAVTLRRKKMVDFFERFITIVLPRVKDFSGIDPRTVDERGALNVGIKEHVVFPEIAPEDSPLSFSLGVAIVPRVKHRGAALLKYRELGVPLKGNKQ
ncbi:50S ribosomal protein L5 [Candidatus Parcubacteria bacterium]|nr:MAG: 50S ribosomal protein L5 [Candidatus Parcubacteria bacterium]